MGVQGDDHEGFVVGSSSSKQHSTNAVETQQQLSDAGTSTVALNNNQPLWYWQE